MNFMENPAHGVIKGIKRKKQIAKLDDGRYYFLPTVGDAYTPWELRVIANYIELINRKKGLYTKEILEEGRNEGKDETTNN